MEAGRIGRIGSVEGKCTKATGEREMKKRGVTGLIPKMAVSLNGTMGQEWP